MFSVGQMVWHRDGRRSGTVLECDGDRIYIAQDNGVELDFPARDLMAAPPAETRAASPRPELAVPSARLGSRPSPGVPQQDKRDALRRATQAVPSRTLTAADITEEHVRVLRAVPTRTVQAVAAIFERRPGAGKFSALDVAAKINAIAAITSVPYRMMRQYSDSPGELGLMMGKGLADSQKSG